MLVGFTGTRKGDSEEQLDQFCLVLPCFSSRRNEFHHGGAPGADRSMAKTARAIGFDVHWHPCPGVSLDDVLVDDPDAKDDVWHEVFPPLVRNKIIVNDTDILIAAPFTDTEELRSGTWATIRFARKVRKPVVMLSRGVS